MNRVITNDRTHEEINDNDMEFQRIVRTGVHQEIISGVIRKKLAKMRHLVIEKAIHPTYLDELFPRMIPLFAPQTVTYNGGIANITTWKISCYLEVMDGGIPCTEPNQELRSLYLPLLNVCDQLFTIWYRQQHSCNTHGTSRPTSFMDRNSSSWTVQRLMTFITRYTPAPGEQSLLKHVDGAGKVDGSVVVALPIDRWSDSEHVHSFEGHGGGLTVWDGKDPSVAGKPFQMDYATRSGDIVFLDRAVWHQANPITKGTRWALVIFYKVRT